LCYNPRWYRICFVLENQVMKTCRGNASNGVFIWGSFAGFNPYFVRKSLFTVLMSERKIKKWHKIRNDRIIDDVWIISNLRSRSSRLVPYKSTTVKHKIYCLLSVKLFLSLVKETSRNKTWLTANLLTAFDKEVKGNSHCFTWQIRSVQIELVFHHCMRI